MKVFISSLVVGMEQIRSAARDAVTTLRHQPIMAEDFGAQQNSPQVACLTGLRNCDIVALILGEHYGAIQASGFSATHEEYRQAKGSKPVIAFVQEAVKRDFQQTEFVREVEAGKGDYFAAGLKRPPI